MEISIADMLSSVAIAPARKRGLVGEHACCAGGERDAGMCVTR